MNHSGINHCFQSRPLTSLLLLITTLLALQAKAQDIDLTWKLSANDKFSITMQQQAKIVSQVDQRNRTSSNDMQMWVDWEVVEVSPTGVYKIEQTIRRITLVTKTPNDSGEQVTNVDTETIDNTRGLAARLGQMIAPLIGATITIQMTERGSIESVVIPETTMESLRQAPESMRLRQLFTEESLSQMFGQAALQTPDQPITSGATWKANREISSDMGSFDQVQLFTLQKQQTESNIQTITLKTELQEKSPSQTGVRLDKFEGSGTFKYNSTEGIFSESRIDSLMVTTKNYSDLVIETNVTSMIKLSVQRQ